MTNKKHQNERRKHPRLPILHGILEPIEIEFYTDEKNKNKVPQPAILSDLSQGGMRLIMFMEPPHAKEFNITLKLDNLEIPVKGKIAWIKQKSEVYMVGISFTHISKEHAHKINEMALDYLDCDIRISLNLPEACVETCKAHMLCNKPQKNEVYFKKK